jgi:integrase
MPNEPNDPRTMLKTATPGVFKRGNRYVVVFRASGRQRKEYARTYSEARRLKAARQTDVSRGEFHEQSRITFRQYAEEWVERYQGRGSNGFRESTREDYRRDLSRYAIPYFEEHLGRKLLSQVTPRDAANFVAWLCDEEAQRRRAEQEEREREAERVRIERESGKRSSRKKRRPPVVRLTDASVRRIASPLRACMRSAVQEGLIRTNPTRDLALPHRPLVELEEEGEQARALTREQLAAFLGIVHPRLRLFFRVLAETGLRVSEAIALEWRHVALDGSRPHVKVRQARVRGRLGLPKSKHGRRDVPLSPALVSALRSHRTAGDEERDLVFTANPTKDAPRGAPLRPENVRNRYLRPAAEEAGAPWMGFHSLRHTCASMLFERGRNAVQVQRWLGHHSPAFTLATYVHLLGDDVGEPLSLDEELAGATDGATSLTPPAQDREAPITANSPV